MAIEKLRQQAVRDDYVKQKKRQHYWKVYQLQATMAA